MATPGTDEHIEDHSSFIRTPKQLLTIVVLAFVVPISAIVLLVSVVTGFSVYDRNHPAMTDEQIARRIQPVGQVNLAEGGAAEAPAAEAAPAPAAPPARAAAPSAAPAAPAGEAAPQATAAADGKSIYQKVCTVCHGPGIAGAPKTGDKAAWEPRLAQGMEVLYTSSIKGKGAMPPKGGAAHLSDADIKAAVDYMVGLVK